MVKELKAKPAPALLEARASPPEARPAKLVSTIAPPPSYAPPRPPRLAEPPAVKPKVLRTDVPEDPKP